MFIAFKVEEVFMPDISDFVLITDNTYSKQDIKNMEIKILGTLNFKLSNPLPLSFLFLSVQEEYNPILSQYILELSLLDYAQVALPPSLTAAAALQLSTLLQGYPSRITSAYSAQQLLPVIQRMAAVLLGAEDHCLQGVRNKYSTLKYGRVAQLGEDSEYVLWELVDRE